MNRYSASGHLIRESPLYTLAGPLVAMKLMSRSAWADVLAERGSIAGSPGPGSTRRSRRPARRSRAPVHDQIALELERIPQIEREGRNQVSPSHLGEADLFLVRT